MSLKWVEAVDEQTVIGSDGVLYHWPTCATPRCTNRVCIGKSDKYCYPCSGSGKSFDELMAKLGSEKAAV